jgi:hypothetical protein
MVRDCATSQNYPDATSAGGFWPGDSLNRAKKLQAKQAHFSGRVLAQYFCDNRRSLTGDKAGRGRRWSRNRQMHDLIGSHDVRRSNTCTCRANIESLGEFDEFYAGRIRATDEHRHLQANAGRAPSRGRFPALLFLKNLSLHKVSLGTKELVRI